MPVRSLLTLFLDNAFEREKSPDRELVRVCTLESDLSRLGLSSLHPRELSFLNNLIVKNSHSSQRELTYGQLTQCLMQEDLAPSSHSSSSLKEKDKVFLQQQRKQKMSQQKVRELDKSHYSIKAIQNRVASQALPSNSSSMNKTQETCETFEKSPQISGKQRGRDDEDVEVVFLVEGQLGRVLDERRARLLDAFKEMDKDDKGKLTKAELGKGLNRLGVYLTRTQLDAFFRILDYDKSGFVEFREFSRILQSARQRRFSSQQVSLGPAPKGGSGAEESGNGTHHTSNTAVSFAAEETVVEKVALDERHISFEVCGEKFYLRPKDILTNTPESLLASIVHEYKAFGARGSVFLDLNPRVFAVIVSAAILRTSSPTTILHSTDPKEHDESKGDEHSDRDSFSGVTVNEHTIRHMCRILSIDPQHVLGEARGNLKKAETAIEGQTKKTENNAVLLDCGCQSRGDESHRFAIQMSKVLTSSKKEGIQVQVRENESLVLETVGGDGQLVMDVYAGDELELKKEKNASDVVIFDSRAFFHRKKLEAIRLGATFKGPANYRFKVLAFERPNGLLSPATLNVSFSIVSSFSCVCNQGNHS